MKKSIISIITIVILVFTLTINTFANGVVTEATNNEYTIDYLNPQAEIGMFVTLANNTEWYIGETITFPTADNAMDSDYNGEIINSVTIANKDILAEININNTKWANNVINSDITRYYYSTYINISNIYDENYDDINYQKIDSQLVLRNFYVWDESALNNDNDEIMCEIRVEDTDTYFQSVTYKYREIYSTEIKTVTVYPSNYDNWTPSINDLTEKNENSHMMYVEEAIINLANPTSTRASFSVYENSDLLSYVLSHSSMNTENPAMNLRPIGLSLASAVGGFLAFEIMPGFSLGGILMVTLAFLCVMWWLKLVAGG